MGFLLVLAVGVIVFLFVKKSKNDVKGNAEMGVVSSAKNDNDSVVNTRIVTSPSTSAVEVSLEKAFAEMLDKQNVTYTKNEEDIFVIPFKSSALPERGDIEINALIGDKLILFNIKLFSNVSPEYHAKLLEVCNNLNNEYGEAVCFYLDKNNSIIASRCMQWSEDWPDVYSAASNAVWYVGYIIFLLGSSDGPAQEIFDALVKV